MGIEKKANTSNIRDIRSGQKVREGTSRARSGEREKMGTMAEESKVYEKLRRLATFA